MINIMHIIYSLASRCPYLLDGTDHNILVGLFIIVTPCVSEVNMMKSGSFCLDRDASA